MKHISEVITKDLGLNKDNSSILEEKTKIQKHLKSCLKDKPYNIQNAYLKNKILYIESKSAEETDALRYEERNIMKLLSNINIVPEKVRFRTTIKN